MKVCVKFKNERHKNQKKAYAMTIKCNACQQNVIHYQKIGRGALKRLWVERVIESEMSISTLPQELHCPFCEECLGVLVNVRGKNCYKMFRGYFSSRIEN